MQFYNILYPYETYFELYDTEYVHFLNSVHVVHCLVSWVWPGMYQVMLYDNAVNWFREFLGHHCRLLLDIEWQFVGSNFSIATLL